MKPFLRYLAARIEEYNKDVLYRTYVTDSLRLIPQNRWIVPRWVDIINPKQEDERTPEEIIEDVVTSAGLIME